MPQCNILLRAKDDAGDALYLGVLTDQNGNSYCATLSGQASGITWALTPIFGTDCYYLMNNAVEKYANFHDSPVPDDPIPLTDLDRSDPEFALRLDDLGGGFVAINNYAKTRIFNAKGDRPALLGPVMAGQYQGGFNQSWQIVS